MSAVLRMLELLPKGAPRKRGQGPYWTVISPFMSAVWKSHRY